MLDKSELGSRKEILMAIPNSDIFQILSWLSKEWEDYNYWPKGWPVDRNNNPIPRGWNTASLVNSKYEDITRRSQGLLKAICDRMSHAGTPEGKADAVLLIRFWKTNRRAQQFADHYSGRTSALVEIWERAKRIAGHDGDLRDLKLTEIGIAVASALVTAISPTRSLGILDSILGSVWKAKGWIDFDIRKQQTYLMDTPFNWRRYSEYVSDLATICEATNTKNLRFTDPLNENRSVFTVHDVEMALFSHYYRKKNIMLDRRCDSSLP